MIFILIFFLNMLMACHPLGIKTIGSIDNDREFWDESKDSVNEAVKILNHKIIPKVELKIPISMNSYRSNKLSEITKNKYTLKSYDTQAIRESNDRNSLTVIKS